MTEGPTTEQLVNFLMVDARSDPRTAGLELNPIVLKHLIDTNPMFKAAALKKHAQLQGLLDKHVEKMERGQLQCEYIRPNGKRCVNFNEPGSYYCGIESHKDGEE